LAGVPNGASFSFAYRHNWLMFWRKLSTLITADLTFDVRAAVTPAASAKATGRAMPAP
jgi:hypothetical protein